MEQKHLLNIPKPGFYYHYKHDPDGELNDHAYEVIGITRDSETKEYGVLYRPLYENAHMGTAAYIVRPLGMFMEDVDVGGEKVPRFRLITDALVITKLEELKKRG